MDTSFYQRAGQQPELDLAGAATKGLSLRKLMTDVQFQPQILEQQLASARAAELSTIEGTRAAEQKRIEEARKIAAQKDVAALYKEKLAAKKVDGSKPIGDDIHREVYESALALGHDVSTLSDLRDRAQTIRQSDLTDKETRQKAKETLFKHLSMEVAKSLDEEDTKRLVGTKMKELMKLGLTQEEAQQELSARLGPDIVNAPKFADARLRAELTPLVSANLAIAQAQDARAAAQQQVDVGQQAAGAKAEIGDIDDALKAIKDLETQFGTRAGTYITQNWRRLVTQDPRLAIADRAIAKHNAANPTNPISIEKDGYQSVIATLRGQRRAKTEEVKATAPVLKEGAEVPPPPGVKSKKPTKGSLSPDKKFMFLGGNPNDKSNWKPV